MQHQLKMLYLSHIKCTYIYLHDFNCIIANKQIWHFARVKQAVDVLEKDLILDLRVCDKEDTRLIVSTSVLQQSLECTRAETEKPMKQRSSSVQKSPQTSGRFGLSLFWFQSQPLSSYFKLLQWLKRPSIDGLCITMLTCLSTICCLSASTDGSPGC